MEATGRQGEILTPDHSGHIEGRHPIGTHTGRVNLNTQFTRAPADKESTSCPRHLLHVFEHMFRQLAKLGIAVAVAGERHCDDGNIVDVPRLHEEGSGARREQILVGHELVV